MQAEDRGGKQGGHGAGVTPGCCLLIHVPYPEQSCPCRKHALVSCGLTKFLCKSLHRRSFRSPRWCSSFPSGKRCLCLQRARPRPQTTSTQSKILPCCTTRAIQPRPTRTAWFNHQNLPRSRSLRASRSRGRRAGQRRLGSSWRRSCSGVCCGSTRPVSRRVEAALRFFAWASALTKNLIIAASARSGLFTYHPALQSLAALGFLEGVFELPIFTSQRHLR